ncbi:MAG: hypothetical protein ACAI44_02120 [Candidatus Sericytochromatia bacterium]
MKQVLAPLLILASLSACQSPQTVRPAPAPTPTPVTSASPAASPTPAASPAPVTMQFQLALKPELLADRNAFFDGKVRVVLYRRPVSEDDPAICRGDISSCYDFSRAGGAREIGQGVAEVTHWDLDKAAMLNFETDKLRPGDTFALVVSASASDACQSPVSASTVRVARAGAFAIKDFIDDSRWSEGFLGSVADLSCVSKSRARFMVETSDQHLPADARLHLHSLNSSVPFDVTLLTDGSDDLIVPGGIEIQADITANGYAALSQSLIVKFPHHPYSGHDDVRSTELIENANSFRFVLQPVKP